jgi:hypothetical protein
MEYGGCSVTNRLKGARARRPLGLDDLTAGVLPSRTVDDPDGIGRARRCPRSRTSSSPGTRYAKPSALTYVLLRTY